MTQGTAALVSTYSAVENMRREYGTGMTNAFTARAYRNAGMTDVTPEIAGMIHEANRLVVQGAVDIHADRQQAEHRAEIAISGSAQVNYGHPPSNDEKSQAAA